MHRLCDTLILEPYLGEGLQAAHDADARLLATVTSLCLNLILQSKEAYVQAYLQGGRC